MGNKLNYGNSKTTKGETRLKAQRDFSSKKVALQARDILALRLIESSFKEKPLFLWSDYELSYLRQVIDMERIRRNNPVKFKSGETTEPQRCFLDFNGVLKSRDETIKPELKPKRISPRKC